MTTQNYYYKMKNSQKPEDLDLYDNSDFSGKKVDTITVSQSNVDLSFTFPSDCSAIGMRIFEPDEVNDKDAIMAAYGKSKLVGIGAFGIQWNGNVSSGASGEQEFTFVSSTGNVLVINDADDDGDCDTIHHYIVKFDFDGETYLVDPRIKNKDN